MSNCTVRTSVDVLPGCSEIALIQQLLSRWSRDVQSYTPHHATLCSRNMEQLKWTLSDHIDNILDGNSPLKGFSRRKCDFSFVFHTGKTLSSLCLSAAGDKNYENYNVDVLDFSFLLLLFWNAIKWDTNEQQASHKDL